MKAARWHARRDVRVDEVPEPGTPPAGWVRLQVEVCGICGTDLEEYLHGPSFIPLEPNPLTGREAPLTLGHELVGVVVESGAGVELAPGARVAVETNLFCGACYWCERGDFPLCSSLTPLGLRTDGGLAEQVLAPAYMCVPYADTVPAELMALAEPLAVAVRAARRGKVGQGAVVGIIGGGAIGQLISQVCRRAGASTIVLSDDHVGRRNLASTLGVDAATHAATFGPSIATVTDGVGADVVFEAAGSASAATTALAVCRNGGRVVLLGVYDDTVGIEMLPFLLGEKQIIASLSHVYDRDFVDAVRMIEEGEIDVRPLITDRIALDEVVSSGFDALASGDGDHVKILVYPGGRP